MAYKGRHSAHRHKGISISEITRRRNDERTVRINAHGELLSFFAPTLDLHLPQDWTPVEQSFVFAEGPDAPKSIDELARRAAAIMVGEQAASVTEGLSVE